MDVRWNTIPTSNFTNGTVKGYIVALQKVGGSEEDETLLVTSCHSDGINVTNLEENTKYCVQVAAFTEYGKGNSTPCMSAVTGERGIFWCMQWYSTDKFLSVNSNERFFSRHNDANSFPLK